MATVQAFSEIIDSIGSGESSGIKVYFQEGLYKRGLFQVIPIDACYADAVSNQVVLLRHLSGVHEILSQKPLEALDFHEPDLESRITLQGMLLERFGVERFGQPGDLSKEECRSLLTVPPLIPVQMYFARPGTKSSEIYASDKRYRTQRFRSVRHLLQKRSPYESAVLETDSCSRFLRPTASKI